MADEWKVSEDILILEARTLGKACSRVAHSVGMERQRVLMLGDNLGVVLAFSRRRAQSFKLLCQIRRVMALALARS